MWDFEPRVRAGDTVSAGDLLGIVPETPTLEHRVRVPPGLHGVVEAIEPGQYTVEQPVAVVRNEDQRHRLALMQRWPARQPRPHAGKLDPATPLVTGQRVIDAFFPIPKGGTAIVPGGFGTGKTVLEQTLAKWADADVVVYVGCGERGNEMTEVLEEFPRLDDPHTGGSLMDRTVLIANTSNMPVAARETSIYTGVTIAEALDGPEAVRSAAFAAQGQVSLKVSGANIMGVSVPTIEQKSVARGPLDRGYSQPAVSSRVDAATEAFENLLDLIIALAASEMRLRRLAEEIGRTTRRVNALDHALIPRLEGQRDYIQMMLEEREREDLFRLKRVKIKLEQRDGGQFVSL